MTDLDRLHEAGRSAEAWSHLDDLWRQAPTAATAQRVLSWAARLPPRHVPRPCRVALLRSCTLEPAVPLLRAEATLSGIHVDAWMGGLNTWMQDVLNADSPLYRFQPDVVVVVVQTSDIAPRLWHDFAAMTASEVRHERDRVENQWSQALQALRRHSAASVVVHTLMTPSAPAMGLLDGQSDTSQGATIEAINATLRQMAGTLGGMYLLDTTALAGRLGFSRWHDARKAWSMRLPFSSGALPRLAHEWVRFLHPLTGRIAKVVVTDLDNTLWGGVLEEDGADALRVGPDWPGAPFYELQRALLDVRQRGILLAVASKNQHQAALDVLARHPGMLLRPEHFSAFRINWTDKAESIRQMARELNVGDDAIVVLDDHPVERAWLRQQVPALTVIELPNDAADYVGVLRDCPLLERLTLTDEDRRRPTLYQAERTRQEQRQQAGSVADFLTSLTMTVSLFPLSPATLGRAAQLTQKTNQFNVSTHRYSETELDKRLQDTSWRSYGLSLADAFGDYGFTGLALVKTSATVWHIDTLLLSCRIIGRTAETALLAAIVDDARAAGAEAVEAWFIPSPRNEPAQDVFSTHGFGCVETRPEGTRWRLDCTQTIPFPAWLERAT